MRYASLAALMFVFTITLLPAAAHASGPVVIVTDDEASQPDAPGVRRRLDSDEPSEGPVIEFNRPTYGAEVGKPVSIDISFHERLAPVDVSSLKVTYLKLIPIDITDRVRDFVSADGIKIANAALPTGSHKVRFSIKDKEARQSEEILKITILEN